MNKIKKLKKNILLKKSEIATLNLEIDYSLATLYDAIQENNTKEQFKCNERLKFLSLSKQYKITELQHLEEDLNEYRQYV